MDYKSETKKAYDLYAQKFDQKFAEHFTRYVQNEADLFIKNLRERKILDLGSGPGNHAIYFQKKKLDVLCVDISEEMVNLCKKKGLSAKIMDIENLEFPKKSFDGVWAYASLLHVKKDRVPKICTEITGILKPMGILGLAVKEGVGEGFETNDKYPNTRRWFSYFTEQEILAIFGGLFEIVHSVKTNVQGRYIFLNYILRLKS